MTDERQDAPDSPNPNEDLDTLTAEQLKSVAVALRLETKRMREHFDKQVGEIQSSCEALGRTIAEQSETLENRGKLLRTFESQRDEAEQRIDDLSAVHERVKAEALAVIQQGGSVTPQHFADALDTYSLAVARLSTTDAHPQIVVALVQMAMHMRQLDTMDDIIKWLVGAK